MNNPNQTPVERAAALYETALRKSRGKQCSEEWFNTGSVEDALTQVTNLLIMEGVSKEDAANLAKAGKLLADTKRRGLCR